MASPLRFLATRAFSNIASSAPATTSPLQQLLMVPKHHPLKFGMGFSLCKTSLSDLIAQTFLEKKEKIDWKRNAAFATFGEREFYSSFVFFLSGYDSLSLALKLLPSPSLLVSFFILLPHPLRSLPSFFSNTIVSRLFAPI